MTRTTTPDETSAELAAIGVEGHSRSTFLLRSALLAGGVYGAAAVSPAVRTAFAQSSDAASEGNEKTDIIVLNFALVLEYLESTYYERGLKEVQGLSDDVKKLVTQIQKDEDAHVDALIQTVEQLGGTKAQRPKFDFSASYASQDTFLKTANTLEDTGVSAYNGAAPLLSVTEVKAAAGSIVQVEGRHAALIRLLREKDPSPQAFDVASKQADVLTAIKPFIVQG
ncbi:ferritin-like domain-containing protein [Patulibacter sp. NPDC049589]|uniref:ferritin-like domain-containing protein n=1 Tax=Patulibacter sp. NPDC049589 TaxID=3154731 RepID=UPI003415BC91